MVFNITNPSLTPTVSQLKFVLQKLFLMPEIVKNISTDGDVIPKIKAASFFLDMVYVAFK